jgi:hypothetical protein
MSAPAATLMELLNVSQSLTLNNFCLFFQVIYFFYVLVGVELFACYFNLPLRKTKIFIEHAIALGYQ